MDNIRNFESRFLLKKVFTIENNYKGFSTGIIFYVRFYQCAGPYHGSQDR